MYLFDTDILSAVAKKRRPEGLMEKLAGLPRAAQFTSAVNVAEIHFGIRLMEGRGEMKADRAEGLLRFFEEEIFARLTILPFDRESAVVYGRLKAALEQKGRPRFEPDLQIASIAVHHGLAIVTGNVRHFGGIPGLKVENWSQ